MTTLIIIFAVTYLLIATEKVDKAVAAGLGASAAIFGRYISYEKALEHVDLNVIFLLLGMMIIVNIFARTGMLEWIAVIIAQKAKGSALTILLLFLAVTALFSAFLDNVTTIILVAPITILITQILETPAIPFLALEAVFSNLGGTATLVGDPPNVIIGSQSDLTFNDFLFHLGPIVLIMLFLFIVIVAFVFRGALRVTPQAKERIMKAKPRLAIVDPFRLKGSLAVFALVLAGFFLGHWLHIEPGLVALSGALLMTLVCRIDMHETLAKVEWTSILFFIGLFMLVGALQENGVFTLLGEKMVSWTEGRLLLTTMIILVFSAVASAVVDNIPLVIAMIPVIKTVIPVYAESLGLSDPAAIQSTVAYPLYWALALGACLGGNGSLVGASANVVIAQIAKRNKYDLTFWGFTRYGLPIMAVSIVISAMYIYLRYF